MSGADPGEGETWGGLTPPQHPMLVTQTALQFNPSKTFQKQLHVMLSTLRTVSLIMCVN